jgi:hypothetical protein
MELPFPCLVWARATSIYLCDKSDYTQRRSGDNAIFPPYFQFGNATKNQDTES